MKFNFKRKDQVEQFAKASNDDNYGKYTGLAIGGLTALGTAMPSWAAIDTAGVTTAITEAATAVGVIGAAVLIVVVGVKAYKWIQRAL